MNKNKYDSYDQNGPDYGFNDGLNIDVYNVRNGTREAVSYTRDELEALPNHGQSSERDARVAEQMSNTYVVMGLGGRAVELALVGNHDAESVQPVMYGWGGNMRHPVAIGEAQALHASNPDTLFVFANAPGAGQSDLLPASVEKEKTKYGRYGAHGEHIVRAIENADFVDGRPIDLSGHSLGARIAIGMAPHLENGARSLLFNDPPGSRKMNLLDLAKSFAIEEGGHIKAYQNAGFDPLSVALQKQGLKMPFSEMLPMFRQQFLNDPRGLGHQSLEQELTEAAAHVGEYIRFISPELSALNNWRAVADILGRVVDATNANTLVEQWVIKNHTHGLLGGSNSGIVAQLYKR